MNKKTILSILVIFAVGFVALQRQINKGGHDVAHGEDAGLNSAMVSVVLPDELSDSAMIGKRLFATNCAACHGQNAAGQKGVAPPLIHIIYEPSHHGDESFQRAVAYGVRSHHWPFGNMPPIEGLTQEDVANIIAYIRELQRANGIN